MTHADWLFDLGNTRLKGAPLRADGSPGEVGAVAHADGDWSTLLPARGRVAYVASVAPIPKTVELLELLATRFERISIARTQAVLAGVRIAYRQPQRLGVDRFLALLGAREGGGGPWLVVGVGTALTIDLLATDGRHAGGRIAPSPTLMRTMLHARASHLPDSGGAYAEFADDTADALVSGCEGAALALVERSLQQAQALLGRAPMLLLHGGGAAALAVRLPAAQLRQALVLEGLAAWGRIESKPRPGHFTAA